MRRVVDGSASERSGDELESHDMTASDYPETLATTIALIEAYTDEGVEVRETSRFDADLHLDSIQVMDLVADIEDAFDINIPLNDLPKMQTVGETAAHLVDLMRVARG
jgi:acyl carrier protein